MIKTRLKHILSLLVLAILAFQATAEDVDDLLAPYKGIPAYCLIIDAASPVVDKGDEFDIKFFISGAGDVDIGQISVTIPPEIVKDNKTVFSYVSGFQNTEERKQKNITYNETRFESRINPLCYRRAYLENESRKLPILVGEAEWGGRPPFAINFTIANDSPAGDHTITIVHYYKYSNIWYLDKYELKLHVNHWYEMSLVQSIGVVLSALGILAVLLSEKLRNKLVRKLRGLFSS